MSRYAKVLGHSLAIIINTPRTRMWIMSVHVSGLR